MLIVTFVQMKLAIVSGVRSSEEEEYMQYGTLKMIYLEQANLSTFQAHRFFQAHPFIHP